MNKGLVHLALLILFCSYLFLFGLGKLALTDPDEPFYAETAREMQTRNEWLTPRIFGEPQFEKPPLYYWLVIISFRTFGVNEFAARFPSSLFGILGIIGIYLFARLLFSEKTAIFSSLTMATCVEYIILARACVTDMVLCVFILYAFLFFFYGLNKNRIIFYLLASISMGLAVLTKGPIGLVLPAFIISLFFLLKKDIVKFLRLPLIPAFVVFLMVSVPWYYLMYKNHGSGFVNHFFGFQNVTRFLMPEHRIGDVFYYYIPVIIGGFFPWSIFLPYGIFTIIRRDKEKYKAHLFLLIWVLTFLIFFSISRTKLPTYIFPLFPALAICIGRFWDLTLENKSLEVGASLSGVFYLILLPLGITLFYLYSLTKYPLMSQTVLKSGFLLTVFLIISCILLIKKRTYLFFFSIVLTFAVSVILLTLFFSPIIELYESSRVFSQYLKNISKPDEKIGAETDYRRGVAFYLRKEDIQDVHKHHIVTKFLDSKQRVWALLKNKNHQLLYTDDKMPFWVPTYIVYEFGKKVIITNKIPQDGKYIKKRSIDEPR